jgi:hypothetical protein
VADSKSSVERASDVSALQHLRSTQSHSKWLGFVEAVVLAIVAVATAWAGYQASRWSSATTAAYALYQRYTVLSQEKATLAGQDRLYDIVTFNGWVNAKVAGRETLASFFQRRFRPEYTVAFKAWMALDPFHRQVSRPGPIFMPQYKNANALEATRLGAISKQYFEAATKSREQGDDYARMTVILATILFLTALSQRFELSGPRAIAAVIAAALLLLATFWILTLPRA